MIKRILTLAVLVMMAMFCFSGCGNDKKSEEQSTFASNLYAAKNPYIENTSANNNLVRLIGVSSYGKYTLSVQDDEHPYTLQIRFMYLHSDTDLTAMDQNMVNVATLLLALIDDCEQVSWSYSGEAGLVEGAIGVDYINEVLGTDVKAAGQDEATFTALCDRLYPDNAPVTEETE